MYLPDHQHTVKDMHLSGTGNYKKTERIKEILKILLGLKPFNKNWATVLYTDFSSKGVGFALTQENPDN